MLMLGAKYYMMLVVCIILLYWKMEKGDYINQFAEFCGFKYRNERTQESLYPHIWNLHYDVIMFVYVYNISDMLKEKEFAWLTHAKFWRNGYI